MIRLSPELLARHAAPSPRYTSYPTVTHWGEPPRQRPWIEHLGAALDATPAGAAVYVHIPFCQSQCTFCGCHMRVLRNHVLVAPYIDLLLAEQALYREQLGRAQLPLSQLYLGGGSPNFLPAGELDRLLDGLLETAVLQPGADLAIEADPRSTTDAQLAVLRRHGFTRLSLGVQDMDPRVQDIVNRSLAPGVLDHVTARARELGFTSIDYDLIHGLPLQTAESMRVTMETVARLAPDRVSFYPYVHVPWIKPSQRRYTEADLPEGEDRRALYLLGRELLGALGYEEIGIDQFARGDDALAVAAREGRLHRNFMGYTAVTTRALIGLGVSAIGDAWTALAQDEKNQQRWETRVQAGELPLQRGHVLTEEDLLVRGHIHDLLTRFATSWSPQELHSSRRAAILARLAPLAEDGLVDCREDKVIVSTTGRAFLRTLCAAFDLKLHPGG
ncbi:MAG: oxygen-independent coproporphyrinogen III oxidase [Steroidobacteraceae bacterium]